MDLFAFPPIAALLDATHGALVWLTNLLTPLAGSASAALAVVLVTLIVRAALIPVGISQARAEQTRARLAPRLRGLQQRFARDPERLRRETMKLYADENASPLAGCLPVLAQAPIIGVIYAVFLHPSIAGHTNALLSHELLGVPLGTSLWGALLHGTLVPGTAVLMGALVLAIALVAELSRRAFPIADSGGGAPALRVLGVLQFGSAVAAVFVPLAAGLYLAVTVTWTLAQRLILRRRYPLP